MSEERRKILEMVENGQISAEEAAFLLQLVPEPEPVDADPRQREQPFPEDAPERKTGRVRTRPYWLYPLAVGSIVMLVGGAVVATAYQQSRVSLWTWLCGWMPLFLGLLVVTIAAWARTAHWVHLRVVDRDDHIFLSFPLPLRFSAQVIHVTRRFIPQFRDTGIDEAILALRDGLNDGQPITIEIDHEEEGEHIEITIE